MPMLIDLNTLPVTHHEGKGICDENLEIEKYAQRLKQANSLITRSIDIIEDNDPNALIILASDHGPYILNRCSNSAPLLTREEVVERQRCFSCYPLG